MTLTIDAARALRMTGDAAGVETKPSDSSADLVCHGVESVRGIYKTTILWTYLTVFHHVPYLAEFSTKYKRGKSDEQKSKDEKRNCDKSSQERARSNLSISYSCDSCYTWKDAVRSPGLDKEKFMYTD